MLRADEKNAVAYSTLVSLTELQTHRTTVASSKTNFGTTGSSNVAAQTGSTLFARQYDRYIVEIPTANLQGFTPFLRHARGTEVVYRQKLR